MWQESSLRARINWLVAAVLALGLLANVAHLVLEAGPRVQAEDRSAIKLTRDVIESVGPGLGDAPDAEARLDRVVADLNRLRHVSIARSDDGQPKVQPADRSGPNGAGVPPSWFVAMIHPERVSVMVPVVIAGNTHALTITSHPDDEMQEIWDGIVTQTIVSLVVALVLFVVTSMVVRRALMPLDALSQAMSDIEAGDYRTRVSAVGPPELAALCSRLNHLAATLEHALEDRRQLAERMVSLQDLERKTIARELHDEFGPHLFALRAHAGAVMRLAERDLPPSHALASHGTAIIDQIDALQQFNRRILERLRPAGLSDLGLAGAVEVLLRLWRTSHPQVTIDSTVAAAPQGPGEAAELTAYRVIQEALTNAFRHAQASHIEITVAPGPDARVPGGLVVRVRDNGRGVAPGRDEGFGLIGMRERVWALGGRLTVTSQSDGVTIEAVIPATQPAAGIVAAMV